jgi:excisionase family DNA binding protein
MQEPRRDGPMTEILTIRELAERFKVSEKTVRRAIKTGRLRAAKLGGDGETGGVWRIALEDARAWFENCATTHAPSSVTPAPRRRRRAGVTSRHSASWRTLRAIEEEGAG